MQQLQCVNPLYIIATGCTCAWFASACSHASVRRPGLRERFWRHQRLFTRLERPEKDAAAQRNPRDARLPAAQQSLRPLLLPDLGRAVEHVGVRLGGALRHEARLDDVQRRRREACTVQTLRRSEV
jgi:hypothetical protein